MIAPVQKVELNQICNLETISSQKRGAALIEVTVEFQICRRMPVLRSNGNAKYPCKLPEHAELLRKLLGVSILGTITTICWERAGALTSHRRLAPFSASPRSLLTLPLSYLSFTLRPANLRTDSRELNLEGLRYGNLRSHVLKTKIIPSDDARVSRVRQNYINPSCSTATLLAYIIVHIKT